MFLRTFLAAIAAATLSLSAWAAVDVNQASRADLETVKGIGPALSAKILDARQSGPFRNWGDLVDRVGGVGAGNAAKLSQAGLTVGGTAFDGAAGASTGTPAKKAPQSRAADKAATGAKPAADKAAPAARPAA